MVYAGFGTFSCDNNPYCGSPYLWSASWEASRGWHPWLLVHNEVKIQPGATVTALWESQERKTSSASD